MTNTPQAPLVYRMKQDLDAFLADDKVSVDEFNGLPEYVNDLVSIKRHLSFLDWRVRHTTEFLVTLSKMLAEHIESETP